MEADSRIKDFTLNIRQTKAFIFSEKTLDFFKKLKKHLIVLIVLSVNKAYNTVVIFCTFYINLPLQDFGIFNVKH